MSLNQSSTANSSTISHRQYCSDDAFTATTGVTMLVCSIVGVILNIISIVIFKQRMMSSPINILLAALCFEDVVVLVLSVPILSLTNLESTCLINIGHYFNAMYTVSVVYLYPVMMMAQSASVWTFVLISLERFNVICRPLHRHRWFTKKEASRAMALLGTAAVLYNLVRFWQFSIDGRGHLRKQLYNNRVYFKLYYTAAYVLFLFVIPFTLLLILNTSLVWTIINNAKGQVILGTKADVRFRRTRQQHKVTLMVVLVTLLFAVCNTLPFVLNIWEALNSTLFMRNTRVEYYLLDISNLLVLLNCSAGPLFYLCFCDRFRFLFMCLVTCTSFNTARQSYSEVAGTPSTQDRAKSITSNKCKLSTTINNSLARQRSEGCARKDNSMQMELLSTTHANSCYTPVITTSGMDKQSRCSSAVMLQFAHRRLSDHSDKPSNSFNADSIVHII